MLVDRIQLPMATPLDCNLLIVKRDGDEDESKPTFILKVAEIGVEAENFVITRSIAVTFDLV
jgi:hypothetical protein